MKNFNFWFPEVQIAVGVALGMALNDLLNLWADLILRALK